MSQPAAMLMLMLMLRVGVGTVQQEEGLAEPVANLKGTLLILRHQNMKRRRLLPHVAPCRQHRKPLSVAEGLRVPARPRRRRCIGGGGAWMRGVVAQRGWTCGGWPWTALVVRSVRAVGRLVRERVFVRVVMMVGVVCALALTAPVAMLVCVVVAVVAAVAVVAVVVVIVRQLLAPGFGTVTTMLILKLVPIVACARSFPAVCMRWHCAQRRSTIASSGAQPRCYLMPLAAYKRGAERGAAERAEGKKKVEEQPSSA